MKHHAWVITFLITVCVVIPLFVVRGDYVMTFFVVLGGSILAALLNILIVWFVKYS